MGAPVATAVLAFALPCLSLPIFSSLSQISATIKVWSLLAAN